MAFYLTSQKVKVFPSAYRGKTTVDSESRLFDPESRLNSEKNLTGLVNRLSSRDSYVLTKELPTNKKITVNIHGYWFELDLSDDTQYSDFDNLYAGIKLKAKNTSYATDSTNTLYEALSLTPLKSLIENDLDDSGDFVGIKLANTESELNDCDYVLHVLTKEEGDWVINPSSLLKYDSSDVANGSEGNKSINEEFNTTTINADSGNIDNIFSERIETTYIESDSSKSDLINSEKITINTTTNNDGLYIKDGNNTIESTTKQKKTLSKDLMISSLTTGGVESSDSISPLGFTHENSYNITPTLSFLEDGEIKSNVGIYYNSAEDIKSFRINYHLNSLNEDGADRYILDLGDLGFTIDYVNGQSSLTNLLQLDTTNGLQINATYPIRAGTILPNGNNRYNLGSSDLKYASVYCTSMYCNSVTASNAITAYSFNATSDRRLKENIKDYKCDKSILDLPVVEFDFKEDGSHHIGCIAQDLQEICPEIVHENKDGYLTIEENKIVYLLLEEVKKLREEIKTLKGE